MRLLTITFLLATMALVATFGYVSVWADAEPENWYAGEAEVGSLRDVCNKETIKAYNILTNSNRVETSEACVMHGNDVDVAYMYVVNGLRGAALVRPHGHELFGFLYETDPWYEYDERVLMDGAYLVPNTNKLIFMRRLAWGGSKSNPLVIDDISASMRPYGLDETGRAVNYIIDSPVQGNYVLDRYMDKSGVYSYAVSGDGKYLAAYVNDEGVIKINLDNYEVTKVFIAPGSIWDTSNRPSVLAMSFDGRYIFVGPAGKIVDTRNCGDINEQTRIHRYNPLENPCTATDASSTIGNAVGYRHKVEAAEFIGRSSDVILSTSNLDEYNSSAQGNRVITLYAAGSLSNTDGLQYLALGDSYSSGEGDNGILFGDKYYRAGTDEKGPPVEKCHISTRSYPYLLASAQNLSGDDWNTVACSSAQVSKDYYGTTGGSYKGQSGRLSDLDSGQVSQYQSSAIENFTPGRVKQIEFVKKYKPKVITVTGAGNDVGFASIIRTCVDPFKPDDTCTYAGDSRGKSMLGQDIKRQYAWIRSMVRELKEASPGATVYYVGYPQFLKETDKTCGLGVSLSITERKVFRDANTYLNNVIKAAAESEGAIYVDIENVLDGHLLCGDNPYVTGYNADCDNGALKLFRGKDECQESFHPKPAGHDLIASSMLAKHPNIMKDNPCGPPANCYKVTEIDDVATPKIFTDAYAQDAKANMTPISGGTELEAQKGNNSARISASTDELQSNSMANAYVTSTPVSLGSLVVGPDGILNLDKAVPDSITAGYHTLHIEGLSKTGDPAELWWIIRILGKDGDVDEDGVPDDQDKCNFMPALGVDNDNDGVDDGCDSDVNGKDLTERDYDKPSVSAIAAGGEKSANRMNSLMGDMAVASSNDTWSDAIDSQPSHDHDLSSFTGASKQAGRNSSKHNNGMQHWLAVVCLATAAGLMYTVIKWRVGHGKSNK